MRFTALRTCYVATNFAQTVFAVCVCFLSHRKYAAVAPLPPRTPSPTRSDTDLWHMCAWLERRQRCSFNKQLAGEILLPTSHSIAPMMMISECCFFVCGAFLSSCCSSALGNFRSNNMRAWTNEACGSLPVPAQCTNCQHMHWRNIVSCPWSCGAVSAFYYPFGQRLHHRARRVYHLALLPLDRPSEQVLRS